MKNPTVAPGYTEPGPSFTTEIYTATLKENSPIGTPVGASGGAAAVGDAVGAAGVAVGAAVDAVSSGVGDAAVLDSISSLP